MLFAASKQLCGSQASTMWKCSVGNRGRRATAHSEWSDSFVNETQTGEVVFTVRLCDMKEMLRLKSACIFNISKCISKKGWRTVFFSLIVYEYTVSCTSLQSDLPLRHKSLAQMLKLHHCKVGSVRGFLGL